MEQSGTTPISELETARAIIAIQREKIRRYELLIDALQKMLTETGDFIRRANQIVQEFPRDPQHE